MNLNHLEYAAAVAKTGSISRAAKEFFVSQPYLSGVIKGMEEELGIQIFHRSSTGMEPTELGAEFLQGAERMLAEWVKLQGLKKRRGTQLQVASYYSPFFMRCFLEMRARPGATSLDSFQEMPLLECFEALSNENVSLSLVCYADCAKDYYHRMAASFQCRCEPLFSNVPLRVMMRPDHPLSRRTSLAVGDLRAYPFVCYRDSLSLLKLMGLDSHPDLLQVSDRGAYFDAIRDGDFLSIIAIVSDGEPIRRDLRYLPLEGRDFSLEFAYTVRISYQLNPREQEFIRLICAKRAHPGG